MLLQKITKILENNKSGGPAFANTDKLDFEDDGVTSALVGESGYSQTEA